jgi:hypothetical protein
MSEGERGESMSEGEEVRGREHERGREGESMSEGEEARERELTARRRSVAGFGRDDAVQARSVGGVREPGG